MSRIDNIKRFAEQKKQSEIDNTNLSLQRIEEYKTRIRELKPRIDELLAVGNACLENDIPLTSSRWGGHEGYDTHQFISNGWSHVTGFISEGNKLPFTKVGKIGGGPCTWNLKTDGNEIIVDGEVERVLKMFLEQFNEFEEEFYKYIDGLTK